MYVCPLHTDIRQSDGGACPACGSRLVREIYLTAALTVAAALVVTLVALAR